MTSDHCPPRQLTCAKPRVYRRGHLLLQPSTTYNLLSISCTTLVPPHQPPKSSWSRDILAPCLGHGIPGAGAAAEAARVPGARLQAGQRLGPGEGQGGSTLG